MKHLRFLILIFILSELPFVSLAQDTSWYSDSETVFTLTTADQILGLRALARSGKSFAGKYIKLGNDIDISSTNWYYGIFGFAGTFDGCNHTIYYRCSDKNNTYYGLFGDTSSGSLITRLRVSGSIYINSSNTSYIGGIVAKNNGRITHCINDVSINATRSAYIGGICGEGSNISYCINTASITVNSSDSDTFWVGGIVGYRGGDIDHCVNMGSINCSGANKVSGFHVGGICGYPLRANIRYCENTNSVSATGQSVFVGGIGGNSGYTTFSCCRNTGSIYATGYYKSGGVKYTASAGGISGYQSAPTLIFDNCYVASSSISASSGYYNIVGHICGLYVTSMIFSHCYANSDCSFRGTNNDGKQYVHLSYTRSQMMSLDFRDQLGGWAWVGGEGVFPIPFGSVLDSEAYTTYQEPSEISFDNNVIDMPTGGRKELLANVLPLGAYPKLTWESSNPDVVTVDEDGVLWSMGLGDAVITATSLRNADVKASCNVHVGTTDLRSIILPETVIVKMNESKKIEREFVPSYAKKKLTWESADELVATVDKSGNVTGVGLGETVITVTDNLTNVQATCTVSVTMEVGDTFKANMSNGAGTVSTTFMLTDWDNRYVSLGDGTNAALETATTGSITIPEAIVGPGNLTYTVTAIGSKAFYSSKISAITIPQGITAIGDDAFNGCSSLTSVTVESTEPLAINSTCFSIKAGATLYVPKGCYEAYKAADVWKSFGTIVEPLHTNGDTFIASITAGSGNTNATFKVIDAANKYVSVGNGEESAIVDYTSGNVVVPSTVKGYDGQTYQVKELSKLAFFYCYEVTSLELPTGITAIGEASFFECNALTSFTIPTNVATIDDLAFEGCYNLTSISIPTSVTHLGSGAFYNCSKLTSVTVNWSEPVAIDDECFTNAANATLNIPKGSYRNYISADNWKNFKTIKEPAHSVGDTFAASVTAGGSQVDATFKVTNTSSRYVSIGDGEDAAIDIFTSGNVVIPSSVKGYDGQTYTVKEVADAAFFGCENITSVSLPTGITGIANSAFLRCYNLASIVIPTSVTSIGSEAFFYCEKLTSISIPKNVSSIGTKAFSDCNNLTSVTVVWNNPIMIDAECFSNATNATLNVPYGSKERYEAATGWKEFKNIVEMAPKDGDIFTALTAEGVKMTFTVISASEKTCKVGDGSNASVPTDTEGLVTIPTTANDFAVTQISSKAFYNCNQITAAEIPTSISSIGTYAFSGCNNLTSVTVGWDQPIAISTNVFSNAANATLYVPIGANYDYSIATGWKDFGQIANKTESTLFADDVIVCRGGQITLPIELSNKENIRSLQFELALPSGVSVVTDGLGNPMAALSERANSTHKITGTPLANGNYQFNILSKNYSDDIIQGTEGLIASIKLKVWKHVTPQDYVIKITDSELTIDNGESIGVLLQDAHSKLTVSSVLLGDVKDDKRVSVTDISNVIDYLLHKQVTNFVFHAADVNGDGRISVSDISTMIDILLHKTVFGEEQGTKIEDLDPQ